MKPQDHEKIIIENISKTYHQACDIVKNNLYGSQEHHQDIRISRKERSYTRTETFISLRDQKIAFTTKHYVV